MIDGFSDPTEDLALVHHVWNGKHLPGLSTESARRVNECSANYKIEFNHSGFRSLLFRRQGGEWLEIPP